MEEQIELLVQESDAGIRVDAYLRSNNSFSRSRDSALFQEGALKVIGEVEVKPSRNLIPGVCLILSVPHVREVEIIPQNIPLDIIYQDSDIVIVNKPCGMVVHPAAGNEDRTLVNALMYHVKDLSGIGGEMRPGIVHRLDKDTSGLILIAKNDHAHTVMSEQFKERSTEKHYRAVAYGNFQQDEGLIDAPIARRPVDRKKMAVGPG